MQRENFTIEVGGRKVKCLKTPDQFVMDPQSLDLPSCTVRSASAKPGSPRVVVRMKGGKVVVYGGFRDLRSIANRAFSMSRPSDVPFQGLTVTDLTFFKEHEKAFVQRLRSEYEKCKGGSEASLQTFVNRNVRWFIDRVRVERGVNLSLPYRMPEADRELMELKLRSEIQAVGAVSQLAAL